MLSRWTLLPWCEYFLAGQRSGSVILLNCLKAKDHLYCCCGLTAVCLNICEIPVYCCKILFFEMWWYTKAFNKLVVSTQLSSEIVISKNKASLLWKSTDILFWLLLSWIFPTASWWFCSNLSSKLVCSSCVIFCLNPGNQDPPLVNPGTSALLGTQCSASFTKQCLPHTSCLSQVIIWIHTFRMLRTSVILALHL